MISTRAADADDATEAVALLRRSFIELGVDGHQNDEATFPADGARPAADSTG